MHAVVFERNGGPDVLTFARCPIRSRAGEALVDVEAVGVNYMDVYEREGKGYGSPPPATPGPRAPARSPAPANGSPG